LGTGPLTEINGDLEFNIDLGVYGVDLYRIKITDATLFTALTMDGAGNVSDPVLWLFDASGVGVYMNDDTGPVNLQSTLPPSHPMGPVAPGYYLLGISWSFYDAISDASDPSSSIFPLYQNFLDTTGVYGPTGSGGANPLAGWTPDSARQDLPAHYDIVLRGATFAAPEPGTLLLFGLAAAFLGFSRRRT
jgi:hypothetical protein